MDNPTTWLEKQIMKKNPPKSNHRPLPQPGKHLLIIISILVISSILKIYIVEIKIKLTEINKKVHLVVSVIFDIIKLQLFFTDFQLYW